MIDEGDTVQSKSVVPFGNLEMIEKEEYNPEIRREMHISNRLVTELLPL